MPEPKKSDDKTFTQDQVNSLIADEKRKVQSQYSDYDELKAKAKKLDEAEASRKSDEQKLLERIEAAEKKAAEADERVGKAEANALRLSVAADKKLPPSLAKRLTGTTREELEADADELLESVKPDEGEKPDKGSGNDRGRIASRPREELRGGGAPDDDKPVETDPAKLAEKVPQY